MSSQIAKSVPRRSNSSGFTIIELMIATLVFSIVLLVVTAGIVQFSKAYYKGAITAKTQDTTRSIIDSVSQSIQFGVSSPQGSPEANGTSISYLCAGGNKFIFTPGVQYKTGPPEYTNAGVYMVPSIGICEGPTVTLPSDGKQLLNEYMRVTDLTLTGVSDTLYTIAVTVAYGDNDLFCDRRDDATCNVTSPVLSDTALADLGSNIRCRQLSGSEFCAVSSLSTTVRKRIQ